MSFMTLITAGVVCLVGLFVQQDLVVARPRVSQEITDDVGYTWNPNLFRIISFGQSTLAVDWLMLKFLTTAEWKRVQVGKRAKQFYDLDLATEVDPAFFALYTAGANFLTVVRNDNEGAYLIISKGDAFRRDGLRKRYSESFIRDYWQNEWRIPLTKAYVELFEMNNLAAASESLEGIDSFPDAPIYLKRLSKRLSDPVGRYEVADRIISQSLRSAKDEREKAIWEKKKRDLAIAWFLAEANEAFKRFPSRDTPQNRWVKFVRENPRFARDPVGGKVFVANDSRLNSETPRQLIFVGE